MSLRLAMTAPSIVLVAALAATLSGCGSVPKPASGSSTADTSALPGTSSPSAATGAAAGSGAASSAASSTVSRPSGAGAQPQPGAATPAHPSANGTLAAPGTYTYTVSGSSPGSDTVAVTNQPSGSTVDEQATVTDQGNQETSDDTWSSASVLLNDVKTKTAHGSADCHFSKPITELQFPLAANASWHSDATCAVSQGTVSGTLHWTETDTVSGTASVTVEGSAVPCWTITRQITVALQGATGQPQGSAITEVDEYAPSIGLPAKTTTTSKSTSRTLTLLHLHPA